MRIVLPGGSGQVGTILARHFHAAGHDVTVLSRCPKPAPWQTLPWDGAVFMRTETELILKSRRAVPTLLERHGFTFDFPTWPEAAADLVARSRKA